MNILGDNGLLNQFNAFIVGLWHKMGLGNTGAAFTPAKYMFTQGAVILVNVYMYLPYAILPIFTAVDRFDFSLLEAARDLGATKPESMFKVLIPGIRSGLISALIFTFIPIFGAYTVPLLVGGKDSYMLANDNFKNVLDNISTATLVAKPLYDSEKNISDFSVEYVNNMFSVKTQNIISAGALFSSFEKKLSSDVSCRW